MQPKNIIQLSDLTKTYRKGSTGEVKAVDNVSLDVPEGQFLTILGPSGSGKTTLLNMIGGLDKPTSGKITLDDLELTKLNEKQLVKFRREKVGFVFQAFNLIPTFSAIENVEAALAPTDMPKNLQHERSAKLLESMGLKQRADHLPVELSAGEQQRVAIARAFANKPRVLLSGCGVKRMLANSSSSFAAISSSSSSVSEASPSRRNFLLDILLSDVVLFVC